MQLKVTWNLTLQPLFLPLSRLIRQHCEVKRAHMGGFELKRDVTFSKSLPSKPVGIWTEHCTSPPNICLSCGAAAVIWESWQASLQLAWLVQLLGETLAETAHPGQVQRVISYAWVMLQRRSWWGIHNYQAATNWKNTGKVKRREKTLVYLSYQPPRSLLIGIHLGWAIRVPLGRTLSHSNWPETTRKLTPLP